MQCELVKPVSLPECLTDLLRATFGLCRERRPLTIERDGEARHFWRIALQFVREIVRARGLWSSDALAPEMVVLMDGLASLYSSCRHED